MVQLDVFVNQYQQKRVNLVSDFSRWVRRNRLRASVVVTFVSTITLVVPAGFLEYIQFHPSFEDFIPAFLIILFVYMFLAFVSTLILAHLE